MVRVVLFSNTLTIPFTLALLGCADVLLSDVAGTGTVVDQSLWCLHTHTSALRTQVDTPDITVALDILQVIHLECADTPLVSNTEYSDSSL